VVFVNRVAQALTGWKQDEALGKNWGLVCRILGEARVPVENPVARALSGDAVVHLGVDAVLVARDGREIPVDGSVAPMHGCGYGIGGAVLVFRDICEHVAARTALRQYTAELEAHIEEVDAFVQTVAHSLKNPLSTVIGYATLLQRDVTIIPNDQRKELYETIVRVGLQACNIVDELVLLSGVCNWDAKMELLHMASIVAQAEKRLEYLIERHQAEIISPERWPIALGYGPWVEEVWVNYLSNGIKYGGRPPSLELGATVQSGGTIRFWVRDNGAGISPENQDRLFTPFTRLRQVSTTGDGLGLSIVRRIVERLGGHVGVESRPGQGSTFFFTLPSVDAGGRA
jgi:PAS domain S-box-containing protein